MAAIILRTVNPPFIVWEESSFASTSVRADGQTAVRHAQVLGGVHRQFEQAMLGWSEYDGAGKLMRYPPEPFPGRPQLVARQVEFVRETGMLSQAGPDGLLQYNFVELAITYENVPGVSWLGNDKLPAGADSEIWRYVHRKSEFEAHGRPLPKGRLAWKEDDKDVLEPGVRLEQESTVYYTWYQIPAVVDNNNAPFLPAPLWSNIQATVMRMNDGIFDGLTKWTALPIAPKLDLVTMSNGLPAFNITYPVLIRGGPDVSASAVGTATPDWTRILRGDGLYHRVYRKSDGTKTASIYDSAPLKKLFQTT